MTEQSKVTAHHSLELDDFYKLVEELMNVIQNATSEERQKYLRYLEDKLEKWKQDLVYTDI